VGSPAFSWVAVVLYYVADPAAGALDRLGNQRGLSAAELRQVEQFEALRTQARTLLPRARSAYSLASADPLREQLQRCTEAAQAGIPLVELLHMRGAVPGDWHGLPPTIDTMLWLGVRRLADDLSLICAVGASSPERQKQLAAVRDLQGALGRVLRASLQHSPSQPAKQTMAKADAKFTRATLAIEDELPAIRAEAAAIRAPRQ
jgi:hypothetical protein